MPATPAKTSPAAGSLTGPRRYAWALALLLVLAAAYGLRSVGRDWDAANPGLHPDERFLSSVLYSIRFPATWGQYFDTATSPLNPENQGFGFFVYGTLPLFLIRAIYEVWNAVQPPAPSFYVLGRALSTLVDVGTVLLVYAVGRRLYGRGPGLLAAAAYALAVMPIQQSHYLTFDNYVTFFTWAALAVALRVQAQPWHRTTWADDALFGLAVGMAVASKVSAAPAAGLLVLAHGLRLARAPRASRAARLERALYGLLLAAAVAFVTFRVWQPYAFRGPHLWNIQPNPNWVANLQALKVQASGEADFPPAMQWARRPWWYGLANLVRWGLGWPLGLSALVGLAGLALRVWRRPLRRDTLLVVWGAGYLAWQSSLWNPTMRYFLPAYPALALTAAWVWQRAWAWARTRRAASRRAVLVVAAGVWLATAAWAWGFTRIYTRPHTRIAASRWFFQNFPAALTVEVRTPEGVVWEPVPYPAEYALTPEAGWQALWRPRHTGQVQAVLLYRLRPAAEALGGTLTVAVQDATGQTRATAQTPVVANDPAPAPPRPLRLTLDAPLAVRASEAYTLALTVDRGTVTLEGARVLNETTWDDGLPLRVDGYDPFGGLYTGLPALEMYWDDNEEKRQRFYDLLDQADVLFITSSRQWGSLPRLPERYPLVTAYYSHLMGCPPTEAIEPCYNRAQVGMFQGRLGFELVAVFESDPTIGPWRINDQPADEAFTVYDHPKVFVFRKRPDYDPERVRALLGAVDLSTVVHVLPGQAPSYPKNLLLPPHLWARQMRGGTWRQLFPPEGLLNRYPGLAVVAWYALGGLLAVLALPALRWPFGALPDRGWPVARLAGMLLWAWLAWWAGDAGVAIRRGLLWALLAGGALAAGVAYARAWADWRAWLRRVWPSLLRVELLYLAFFALDLLIRYLNPDLWHPWKGGEKPMDFAYFNAVLKSTVVPPYDPWFAKGFINYYYWGFALVGMPVKALGIRPAVAYNLILPTLFAGVATAAFALGRGLAAAWPRGRHHATQAGLAAAVGTVLLGNLGTVRMLWEGLVRLGLGGRPLPADLGLLERIPLALEGLLRLLAGDALPYIPGDWYWFPSRIIPAPGSIEPITEFPYFTFLYADLHAHMIALGVTLMALLWGWAVVRAARRAWAGERLRGWAGWRRVGLALFWGGLIVGALRAINTWDYPTYLLLTGLALTYAWVVARGRPRDARAWAARLAEAGLGGLMLYALTVVLWRPYLRWYAQGYAHITLWWGPTTPLSAYFWHWGLFYFVTLTWLGVLVVDWLRAIPAVEGLRWWRRGGRWAVLAGALLALGGPALLQALYRTPIGWVTLPPLVVITALLLRPDQDDATRFGLTLWAAALSLTLMVEIIVLVGDLERMNTVFKFYLQAWVLWASAAALGLVQVLRALRGWPLRVQTLWTTALTALVLGAFLFTWMATLDKVRDRMAPDAPHTLDGQAYMAYAQYFAPTGMLDLSEDYRAIRWLLAHVDGSPVIVEANTVEYQWGSRIAINTGLPTVVGWNWHQRQQRGVIVPGDWVTNRIAEVAGFYTTTERAYVEDFLRRYEVTYIVVGQLERATYPGPGLEKFRLWDGDLWQEVYRDGATVIYRVRR